MTSVRLIFLDAGAKRNDPPCATWFTTKPRKVAERSLQDIASLGKMLAQFRALLADGFHGSKGRSLCCVEICRAFTINPVRTRKPDSRRADARARIASTGRSAQTQLRPLCTPRLPRQHLLTTRKNTGKEILALCGSFDR